MKLKITKPDIISKNDFNKTDIEKVFTSKKDQEVAFVDMNHAIVISNDDGSKSINENKQS